MSSNIVINYDTDEQRDNAILVIRNAIERHIDRLEGEIDLNDIEYQTCDNQEAIVYLEDAMTTIDNYYER